MSASPLYEPSAPVEPPTAIAVLIGQLTQGGSERQLYFFLRQCDRSRWSPVVYVSGSLGVWEDPLKELGVPVVLLRGSRLAKLTMFRSQLIAQQAKCFFSWSSYTNGFALALIGLDCLRIGSFRNAVFSDLPTRQRWLWSRISLVGLDIIICNSRETEKQLTRLAGLRQKVVYAPNALQIFSHVEMQTWRKEWRAKLEIGDDETLILGVGRLAPQKRFDRFIKVVDIVIKSLPVRAAIAGENMGLQRELEEQVRHAGLERLIRILGPVPDARELMCAADIFLLTSDYEGTPNVILEAMAAGVSCVSTPLGGVQSVLVDERTGIVSSFDAEDLARDVLHLASDKSLRNRIGSAAQAAAALHADEDVMRKIWSVCEDAM